MWNWGWPVIDRRFGTLGRFMAVAAWLLLHAGYAAASPSSPYTFGTPSLSHETVASSGKGYPVDLEARPWQKLDTTVFMRVGDAEPLVRGGKLTVVDLRSPAAFARDGIPGSINVKPYALASKAFLRDTPLLLVDEGYHAAALASLCAALKSEGFRDVHALFGGIQAWRRRHGAIPVSYVPAREFFKERGYRYWLIVDASGRAEARKLFPAALRIALRRGWQQRVASAWKRDATQGFPPLVLVVGRDAKAASAIEAGLARLRDGAEFYVLDGGLKGYRGFLQRQALAWEHLLHPPQPAMHCGD